jgi:hypothetical protein
MEKAKSLVKESGYKGEPVRLMAAPQYDYMIKVGQVAYQNLTDAGINVDLKVLDWATVLQVRKKPPEWEGFVTGEGGETDPSQVNVFNKDYPGWWDSPDKRAVMDQFVTEPDHQAFLSTRRSRSVITVAPTSHLVMVVGAPVNQQKTNGERDDAEDHQQRHRVTKTQECSTLAI